MSLVTKV